MMLSQKDFEVLLAQSKHFKKPNRILLPMRNDSRIYELEGDGSEEFLLDYDRRGTIELNIRRSLRK